MKVGCFALIDPFSTLEHQLQRIADMGFKYADVTDSHPGSSLGRDYGFAATASLDGNDVTLAREIVELNKNALKMQIYLAVLGSRIRKLRAAIEGR